MPVFAVTYEIITEESARDGDSAAHGYVDQNLSLRDAIRIVNETESSHCSQECIESSDSRVESARWFTVYNSMSWIDGECENRSLHIPDSVTPSSRRRIARLLGVRA